MFFFTKKNLLTAAILLVFVIPHITQASSITSFFGSLYCKALNLINLDCVVNQVPSTEEGLFIFEETTPETQKEITPDSVTPQSEVSFVEDPEQEIFQNKEVPQIITQTEYITVPTAPEVTLSYLETRLTQFKAELGLSSEPIIIQKITKKSSRSSRDFNSAQVDSIYENLNENISGTEASILESLPQIIAGELVGAGNTGFFAQVGVGTTTSLAKLAVQGGGVGTDKTFEVTDSTGTSTLMILDNGNGTLSGAFTAASFAGDGTNITGITTTQVAEGANVYYTQGRFDTAFAAKSTTDLTEGANLYYTNTRARSSVSSSATGLTYTPGTGVLSLTPTYVIPTQAELDAKEENLTFAQGLTRAVNTVTNNLITGITGGQTITGGTGATDALTLKGTTGNGTPASPAFNLNVGNDGSTNAITVLNNGNVGVGTDSPDGRLHVQTSSSSSTGIYIKDSSSQSSPALHYERSDGVSLMDIKRSSSGGGQITLFNSTGSGEVKLTGNNALIVDTGSTASLRLLPSGNDVYLQNTNTSGDIFLTGSGGGDLTGKFNFRNTGDINFGSSGSERMFIASDGNVGIGTTTPSAKLEVAGLVYQTGLGGSTYFGESAGKSDDLSSNGNAGFGYQSLEDNTTGDFNSAFGYRSLRKNTTGERNTANGYLALSTNTEGRFNTALGNQSLRDQLTGDSNTAIGYQSLIHITTGSQNIAMGVAAGRFIADGTTNNETSEDSSFIGTNTKASADGVSNENVFGYGAIGSGSNTVTLGNDSIVTTVLKGNIGIGTSDPSDKLALQDGRLSISGTSGFGEAIKVDNTETINFDKSTVRADQFQASSVSDQLEFKGGTSDTIFLSSDGSEELLTIADSGNITMQPFHSLNFGSGTYSITGNSSTSFQLKSWLLPFKFVGSGGTAMFIDPVNPKVGIGTESPDAKLQIKGDGTTTGEAFSILDSTGSDLVTVLDSGNVGIGTDSPKYAFSANPQTNASYTGQISIGVDSTYGAGPVLFLDGYNETSTYKMYVDNSGGFHLASPNDTEVLSASNSGVLMPRLIMTDAGTVISPSLTLDKTSSSEVGLYVPGGLGSNTLGFITDRLERMRIDADGNVGIGTRSPSAKLQVKGDGTTTGEVFSLLDSTGSDLVTVLDSGYMGVGTDNPTARYQVNGSVDGTAVSKFVGTSGQTADLSQWYRGTSEVASISADGYATFASGNFVLGGAGAASEFSQTGSSGQSFFKIEIGAGGNGQAGLVSFTGANTDIILRPGIKSSNWATGPKSLSLGTLQEEKVALADTNWSDVVITRNLDGDSSYSENGANLRLYRDIKDVTTESGRFMEWANSSGTLGVIDKNGNVGIGTTTPSAKLEVAGLVYQTGLGDSTYFGDGAGGNDDLSDNRNVGVGYQALRDNTTGERNSAQGYRSLFNNTTGSYNSAQGFNSLFTNIGGDYNSAQGFASLQSNTTGDRNSAQGVASLFSNTTGDASTAQGYNAGRYITDGSTLNATSGTSVFIGAETRASADGVSNENVFGYGAIGSGSNTVTLGNDSITDTILKGNIGIGTDSPGSKISVVATSFGTPTVLIDARTSTAQAILRLNRTGVGRAAQIEYSSSGTVDWYSGMIRDGGNPTNDWSLSTANDISVEAPKFIVKKTTGRVGIGTDDPTGEFEISAASTPDLYINYQADLTGYTGIIWRSVSDIFEGSIQRRLDDGSINIFTDQSSSVPKFTVAENGNVGIGTTTPSAKLEVAGLVYQTGLGGSTFFGESAGENDDLNNNSNSGFGYRALKANTTGIDNTANGYQSLRDNTTGSFNTSSGYNSLVNSTEGNNNAGFGYRALQNNTTGGQNTAIGSRALQSNIDGVRNTTTGNDSLSMNTTGDDNTAIGVQAMRLNTEGNKNTGSGYRALYSNTTGNDNTAQGYQSGMYIADGSTANETSGTSVFIGSGTRASADGVSNEVVVGYGAVGSGSNTVTIGNSSITDNYFYGDGIFTGDISADNISGTNTGDQSLSNYVDRTTTQTIAGLKTFSNETIFDGNVGIGTDNPSYKLTVDGGGSLGGILSNNSWDNFVGISVNESQIYSGASIRLSSRVSGVQRMWDMTVGAGSNTRVGSGNFGIYDMSEASARLVIENGTGNVGIGTTTPSAKLEVAGHVYQTGLGDSTYFGDQAGENDDLSDNDNTGFGYQALKANTTGSFNTANGFRSLSANTTGGSNTADGYLSLTSSTTGNNNTASGRNSLSVNTTGSNNTASGYFSLSNNTEGNNNTASGFLSLHANTTGSKNTASGYQSLYSIITGSKNTAQGYNSGRYIADGTTANTTSGTSVFIGADTRASADGVSNENVFGYGAIGSGSNTVTLGNDSIVTTVLKGNVGISDVPGFIPTGLLDIASEDSPLDNLSSQAEFQINSRHNRSFTGKSAGMSFSVSEIDNNVGAAIVHERTDTNSKGNLQFFTKQSTGLGDDPTLAMIMDDAGNVGINTTNPLEKLHVDGTIRASNLTGGATNLTTDANGNIIRDPSDRKLKKNINTLEGSLDRVLALRGVSYDWKDTERFGTQTEIGFIAQEVELIVPEVVRSGGEYKSINTRNLIAIAVGGIQELYEIVIGFGDKIASKLGVFDELCVGEVCITEEEFLQIVNGSVDRDSEDEESQGGSGGSSSEQGEDEQASEDTQDQNASDVDEPEESDSGDEPTEDPAPEEEAVEDPIADEADEVQEVSEESKDDGEQEPDTANSDPEVTEGESDTSEDESVEAAEDNTAEDVSVFEGEEATDEEKEVVPEPAAEAEEPGVTPEPADPEPEA